MKQVQINGDALHDVLNGLLGPQGAQVVNDAYVIVDNAEKRGHQAGFEEGFKAGESDGYNIGYDHGIQDGDDDRQNYADDAFNRGWEQGYNDYRNDQSWIDWPINLNSPTIDPLPNADIYDELTEVVDTEVPEFDIRPPRVNASVEGTEFIDSTDKVPADEVFYEKLDQHYADPTR